MIAKLAAAVALLAASAHAVHADPLLPVPAQPRNDFDRAAQTAERVPHIEDLVWALVAPCDTGDDLRQRQCRHARDARLAEYTGKTLHVGVESSGLVGGDKLGRANECIRCDGVEIDGKRYYVTMTKPNPPPQPINQYTFAEFLVTIPAHPRWSAGGATGIALDVGNWVQIDASPVIPNRGASPDPPDELSSDEITAAMATVVDATHRCYDKFAVAGTAILHISIKPDGSVGHSAFTGGLAGTPTAACVEQAIGKLTLRASPSGRSFDYPLKIGP